MPFAEDRGADLEGLAGHRDRRAAPALDRWLDIKDRDSSNHAGYATEDGSVHASAGRAQIPAPYPSRSMNLTAWQSVTSFGMIRTYIPDFARWFLFAGLSIVRRVGPGPIKVCP